jgi:hypothetical protein
MSGWNEAMAAYMSGEKPDENWLADRHKALQDNTAMKLAIKPSNKLPRLPGFWGILATSPYVRELAKKRSP